MGRLTRKMNLLIEEAICRDLAQPVPPGQRSRVVDEALRKELEQIRMKSALRILIEKSSATQKLTTQEIVDGLSRDRSSH